MIVGVKSGSDPGDRIDAAITRPREEIIILFVLAHANLDTTSGVLEIDAPFGIVVPVSLLIQTPISKGSKLFLFVSRDNRGGEEDVINSHLILGCRSTKCEHASHRLRPHVSNPELIEGEAGSHKPV